MIFFYHLFPELSATWTMTAAKPWIKKSLWTASRSLVWTSAMRRFWKCSKGGCGLREYGCMKVLGLGHKLLTTICHICSFDEDGSGSVNMTEFLLKLRVSKVWASLWLAKKQLFWNNFHGKYYVVTSVSYLV